jgi:hypothetical protein
MGRICELTCGAFVWGKGAPQIPPLRYAPVPRQAGAGGMTNLFGGELESAIRFGRSFLSQLATGKSAPPTASRGRPGRSGGRRGDKSGSCYRHYYHSYKYA